MNSFSERIGRSFTLLKESWLVLRNTPSLAIFPIISAIAVMVASVPFIAGMVMTGVMRTGSDHVQLDTMHYVLVGGMYLVDYFIVIFFNSALVACAYEGLNGRPVTVEHGMRVARQRLPQIFGYALIASTVGVILKAIQDRAGIFGQLAVGLIGMAWNLAVFLVVPLLVIEKQSSIGAVKESAAMLKRSWGEQIAANLGLGMANGLLFMAGFVLIICGAVLCAVGLIPFGIALMVAAVFYWLAHAVIMSSLGVIFQTGLYIYCRTGEAPGAFSADTMQSAFAAKPQKKFFGR